MNDTPKDILQKQFEIIISKPLKERLNGLFEMTELSRKIIQNRIITRNPNMSEADVKVELFKAFYRSDFDKSDYCLMKLVKFCAYNQFSSLRIPCRALWSMPFLYADLLIFRHSR